MDDIFGLEKYNNIERVLKLENELYRQFWDIIASQQARYESLTEMVNKNLYINQTIAMLSERMDKIMVTSKNPQKYRPIEAFSIIGQTLTRKQCFEMVTLP